MSIERLKINVRSLKVFDLYGLRIEKQRRKVQRRIQEPVNDTLTLHVTRVIMSTSHSTNLQNRGRDRLLKRRAMQILATAIVTMMIGVSTSLALAPARWRVASEVELKRVIPARAPVIRENIETEFRTASGITDGKGNFIAGVVMITAGYSAEGKYSHFFITQVGLKFDELSLQPGEYVFGYQRKSAETIRISFYRASTGEDVGEVEAHVNKKSTMVRFELISASITLIATFLLCFKSFAR